MTLTLSPPFAEIQKWWRWWGRVWRNKRTVLEEIWLGKERCRCLRCFSPPMLGSSCSKYRKIQCPDNCWSMQISHQAMRLLHTMFIKNLAKTADLKAFEVHWTVKYLSISLWLNSGTSESLGAKGDVRWGRRSFGEMLRSKSFENSYRWKITLFCKFFNDHFLENE